MNSAFSKLILTFLLILTPILSNGQYFRAGLKGGLTTSKVSGDYDPMGGRFRVGVLGNIFTNYPLSDYSCLQLELMYIQKGSRAFQAGTEPDEEYRDYRLDLHYVEIPVVYFLELSQVTSIAFVDRFAFEAGLSYARVVGHYEENYRVDITDREAERRPFRSGELNLLFGFYYTIIDNLDFHFRLSQGVTPIRPHGPEGGDPRNLWHWFHQFGQYNTVYSFGLSYTIFSERGETNN